MKLMYFFILLLILLIPSCKDNSIIPPLSSEPDSTSHNFIWEIDTLGNFQSYLLSAWGIDANNIWAVGSLYLDSIPGSNISHWDGNKWSYENIFEGDLVDITGFSASDVWAVGSFYNAATPSHIGAYIVHWNGQNWKVNKESYYEGLSAIWGKSSNSLYAVGRLGTILHYNGNSWSKMTSGTNFWLTDIWGTSDNDIYAVGGDDNTAAGVMLHYNGTSWGKIYETTYREGIPSSFTTTIWGIDKEKYYINSAGIFSGKDSTWNLLDASTDHTRIEKIRGHSDKNIFLVGHFGLMVHWNGKSWKRYDEFFKKPEGDLFYGVWVGEQDVVIVGRSDEGARGIVYRGKMIY